MREHILCYRERASEYDEWTLRLGRYDRGGDANRRWSEQVEEVRRTLKEIPLDDKNVVVLAVATGTWTTEICERVAQFTVVDASREMITPNMKRLEKLSQRVRFIDAALLE